MMDSNILRQLRAIDPCGGSSDRGSRRRGFTLVEILVVVAIIAILFSLVGVVLMSGISAAKVGKTKATIIKVQGLLQQRLDSVMRKDPEKTLVDSLAVPGRFPNRKQAEAMARKFTFRQAFPQTWAEIALYYPNLLPQSGETAPMPLPPPDDPAQSSEVLYFLLMKANVLGYPPEGDGSFDSTEVRDTNGNGKMEFIDAWNNPLRFYRWPTRLIRGGAYVPPGTFTPSPTARGMIPSLPTTTADLMHDADDKYGFLKVLNPPAPQTVANGANGLLVAEVPFFEQGGAPMSGTGSRFFGMAPFHTPQTYSFPLIISAGADFTLGLYEPGNITNLGYLAAPDTSVTESTYDNISNLSIRSGGK